MQPVPEKLRGPKTDWNWATYFAVKKQKLEAQFDKNRDELNEEIDDEVKSLFKNVSIFVNGYTNPTAIELKHIMLKYGGYFYEYLNENITHIIASNLAYSKSLVLKSKLVVKPEWIIECIKEKKILPTEPYLVIQNKTDQNKLTDFMSKNVLKTPKTSKSSLNSAKKAKLTKKASPIKNNTCIKSDKSLYKIDYDCFQTKLDNFELPIHINKKQSKQELEIEKIKHLLSDWIFWTGIKQEQIDTDDLHTFKSYLLYILNDLKDLEKLILIFKLFKRLVIKNGSTEWVDAFKDVYSSVQADFYTIYDSTFII